MLLTSPLHYTLQSENCKQSTVFSSAEVTGTLTVTEMYKNSKCSDIKSYINTKGAQKLSIDHSFFPVSNHTGNSRDSFTIFWGVFRTRSDLCERTHFYDSIKYEHCVDESEVVGQKG